MPDNIFTRGFENILVRMGSQGRFCFPSIILFFRRKLLILVCSIVFWGENTKKKITGRSPSLPEILGWSLKFASFTYKCSAEDCLGDRELLLVMMDPGSIYQDHIVAFT
jgi:hypothetical protein